MGSLDDNPSLADHAFAPIENSPRIYPQPATLVDLSSNFAGRLPGDFLCARRVIAGLRVRSAAYFLPSSPLSPDGIAPVQLIRGKAAR